MNSAARLREDALRVWQSAVNSVEPEKLVRQAVGNLPSEIRDAIDLAENVYVVGCGKAGSAMAHGLEAALPDKLPRIRGLLNVPAGFRQQPVKIRLHAARQPGSNHPTMAGVEGTLEMLRLLESAGPEDVAICLLSGGGSALLPAPANGLSLMDKQLVTSQLHACGATIQEMNTVRKHLSRVKGGQLATAFRGKLLLSLIISDVVGDPLDVIASGPTAPDPTTYDDALSVLRRFRLIESLPSTVVQHLERGRRGELQETLKKQPSYVQNLVIGNNRTALDAAKDEATKLGYQPLDLGAFVEGDSAALGQVVAGLVRSIRSDYQPISPPCAIIIGGETTVDLGNNPGEGGRNQEFVLATAIALSRELKNLAILSGGTDGEDGPTDAAGGLITEAEWDNALVQQLEPEDYLRRHDSYQFLSQCDGLIRTGLTGTNVMDLRVILVRE